jgi:ribosomal protein S18 acetylase RimI-like enzyme
MELIVRRLLAKDAEIFWELRREALLREPLAFASSAEKDESVPIEELRRRVVGGGGADNFVLGAFVGGALAGMCGFVREQNLKERHKGWIWGVYVKSEFRRRGIGKKMLSELLHLAGEKEGLEQVTLSVGTGQAAARRLYSSLGFVTFGIEPRYLKVGAVYVDEEHMMLRLPRKEN